MAIEIKPKTLTSELGSSGDADGKLDETEWNEGSEITGAPNTLLGFDGSGNATEVDPSSYYKSGGTDVAIADGGTGASSAAAAATNLGLGTGDSPQHLAVNIGHATDTTLARASAGNLSVEGNLIYRAGGTDVPIADGGTGASSASAARDNLGLGTGNSPTFTAITTTGNSTLGDGGGDLQTINGGLRFAQDSTFPGTASADGYFYHSNVLGLVAYGHGTSYDLTILNRSGGGVVARVPANTIDFEFLGNVSIGGNAAVHAGNVGTYAAVKQTFLQLAAAEVSTSTTPALISDANGNWTIPVTNGKKYRIRVNGLVSTAAAATGWTLNVTSVSSAAGTFVATGFAHQTATVSMVGYSTLPINLVLTAVPAGSVAYPMSMDITFACTASGSLEFRWATEVAASAATLAAGSTLIVEEIA